MAAIAHPPNVLCSSENVVRDATSESDLCLVPDVVP